MSVGQFWLGHGEENFDTGPYDTREEAIADAEGALSLERGDQFFTGVEKEPRVPEVDVDWMLEHMYCGFADLGYTEVVVEGWPNATPEAIQELRDAMNKVFREWHDKRAAFSGFAIEDVQSHVLPEKKAESVE